MDDIGPDGPGWLDARLRPSWRGHPVGARDHPCSAPPLVVGVLAQGLALGSSHGLFGTPCQGQERKI